MNGYRERAKQHQVWIAAHEGDAKQGIAVTENRAAAKAHQDAVCYNLTAATAYDQNAPERHACGDEANRADRKAHAATDIAVAVDKAECDEEAAALLALDREESLTTEQGLGLAAAGA